MKECATCNEPAILCHRCVSAGNETLKVHLHKVIKQLHGLEVAVARAQGALVSFRDHARAESIHSVADRLQQIIDHLVGG